MGSILSPVTMPDAHGFEDLEPIDMNIAAMGEGMDTNAMTSTAEVSDADVNALVAELGKAATDAVASIELPVDETADASALDAMQTAA